jgi:hypothetical protein
MASEYIADPVGIRLAREANAKQVGGQHYQGAIQTWDYIVANDLGYLEGNVIKYVSRYKKKNGIEDLKKADHYLQKLMETVVKTQEKE